MMLSEFWNKKGKKKKKMRNFYCECLKMRVLNKMHEWDLKMTKDDAESSTKISSDRVRYKSKFRSVWWCKVN